MPSALADEQLLTRVELATTMSIPGNQKARWLSPAPPHNYAQDPAGGSRAELGLQQAVQGT